MGKYVMHNSPQWTHAPRFLSYRWQYIGLPLFIGCFWSISNKQIERKHYALLCVCLSNTLTHTHTRARAHTHTHTHAHTHTHTHTH